MAGHGRASHLVGTPGCGRPAIAPRPSGHVREGRVGPCAEPASGSPLPSQHVEPWLKSDSSHERQRAVQTIFLFLKYVVDYVGLTVSRLARHSREGSQEGGPEPREGPGAPTAPDSRGRIHGASRLLGTGLGGETQALGCPQYRGRGQSSKRAVEGARWPGRLRAKT